MNMFRKTAITLTFVLSIVLGGTATAAAAPTFDLLGSIASLFDTGSSSGSGGSHGGDDGAGCEPFC